MITEPITLFVLLIVAIWACWPRRPKIRRFPHLTKGWKGGGR